MPRGRRDRSRFPPDAGDFAAILNTSTPFERIVGINLGSADWAVTGPNFSRKGRGLHTLAEPLFGVSADLAARTIAEVIGADEFPRPPGDADPSSSA